MQTQPFDKAAARHAKYIKLGDIMLKEYGKATCISAYGTDDPEWVGRHALQYGDINADGTLN